MRLNFWQWLGILLLATGIAVWLYEHRGTAAQPASAPTTQTGR